ncbi:MAG TPA: TlpA disulfide reductase family protein [Bryobacteraceae bacterium]|nr:TlpA disulfide reductase family protein [Bryobacteraceae bacterium]
MEKNSETLDQWVDERLAAISPDNEWRPDPVMARGRLGERLSAGWGRGFTWAAAAATAAALGLLAFSTPRSLTPPSSTSSVKLNPQAKLAPEFSLKDAAGNTVKLSDFRGKVVLLNFWATWCTGCILEIPWFVEFQHKYGERNLAVLGVSMDEDGWESVKPFLAAKRINYRMMIGNDEVAKRFGGVSSLPITFLIDRSGRIAATHTGIIGKVKVEREVEALLRK